MAHRPERIQTSSPLRKRRPAQTGAQIYVKVSNAQGSATEQHCGADRNQLAATAPTITQQPANHTVSAGQAATFRHGHRHLAADLSMVHERNAVGTNSNTYTISQTTRRAKRRANIRHRDQYSRQRHKQHRNSDCELAASQHAERFDLSQRHRADRPESELKPP